MATNFNPVAAFSQGMQTRQDQRANQRQNKIFGLQDALAGQAQQGGFNPSNSPEFQQLAALDPDSSSRILSTFNALSKERKQGAFDDARQSLRLLESGDANGFLDLVSSRIDNVERLGGDSSGVRSVLDTFNTGDIQGTISQLRATEAIGIEKGFLKDIRGGGPVSIQSSKIYEDGTVLGVKKGGGRIVTNPDGTIVTGTEAREIIQNANKKELKRKRELSKLSVDASLAKERAKGLVAREKEDITLGVGAAQTIPILMRADRLLDIVGTGKPQQALLWGKKMLGLESGDETELEQLLGKQIVKQLKPTFGGSFSVGEGEWLKSMEAEWGRSTEGNRRLVRQGLALANKRSDIGFSAAETSGDTRTMDVIQGYRDWRFPEATQKQDAQKSVSEMSLEELKALRASQGG